MSNHARLHIISTVSWRLSPIQRCQVSITVSANINQRTPKIKEILRPLLTHQSLRNYNNIILHSPPLHTKTPTSSPIQSNPYKTTLSTIARISPQHTIKRDQLSLQSLKDFTIFNTIEKDTHTHTERAPWRQAPHQSPHCHTISIYNQHRQTLRNHNKPYRPVRRVWHFYSRRSSWCSYFWRRAMALLSTVGCCVRGKENVIDYLLCRDVAFEIRWEF